jgi:hypothetical protein
MATQQLNERWGILAAVSGSVIDPHKCYLLIDHEGRTYTGELWFDDIEACTHVCERLKRSRGRLIRDIAELAIHHIEATNVQ